MIYDYYHEMTEKRESKQVYRILICGDSGSGKSHLSNKLAKAQLFSERNSQKLETFTTIKKRIVMDSITLELIDTCCLEPNSGHSRIDMLKEILGILQECKEGIHAMIYCLPVTERFKTEKLKQFGLIFGQGVYKNLIIARTKFDRLSASDQGDFRSIAIPEMFEIITEDSELNGLDENQLLFSDSSTEANFQKTFYSPFLNFLFKKTPYIHPLSYVDMENLTECSKIPEFANLMNVSKEDLRRTIATCSSSLRRWENKRKTTCDSDELLKINENISKQEELLSKYTEELNMLEDLTKDNTFMVELNTKSKIREEIHQYLYSHNPNSLYFDLLEISNTFAEGKKYQLLNYFQNDIIHELEKQLPRILKQRIMDILQTHMINFQNHLTLKNEEFTLQQKPLLYASILSFGLFSYLSLDLFVTVGVFSFVFFIAKNAEKQFKWNPTDVINNLVKEIQPRLAINIEEAIQTEVENAINHCIKANKNLH